MKARAAGAAPATPTALITGATSGIGEALADAFAAAGCNVVLVARRAARLRERAAALAAAHGVRAWAMPADLVLPGAVATLAAALRRARRPVDILVNNAGVLQHGPFAAMPAAHAREMVALNVLALTEMLAHFVPPMVARGRGRVLNVASIAAFQPVPGLATYAATKAYVLSLTESLAEELRGSGVTVTALCPGITATHMLGAAQRAGPALRKLPRWVVGSAVDVASEGLAACMAGEVLRVPGAVNVAATLAGRATPRWALRRLVGVLAGSLK